MDVAHSRILLVLPDEAAADLRALLAARPEWPSRIDCVPDAATTLAAGACSRYDACIIGEHLGDTQGLDLVRTLRTLDAPPCILVAPHVDQSLEQAAAAAGAVDCLAIADLTPALLSRVVRHAHERAQRAALHTQALAAAAELARMRQEQAAAAEAMVQVSAALASALEPEQVYARILDQVQRVLPYDHAAVLLYEAGWVAVAGSQGKLSVPIGTRVFQLADLAQVAAHGVTGKPALIRDTANLETWIAVPPFTGAYQIRSLIVVPLVVQGTVLGTFNVDSFIPDFYTEQHLAVAMTFADRVTQALQNARLFTTEQQRAHAAEELAQIRRDFAAVVSHELRTPLTAMIGYSELLQARWPHLSDRRRLDLVGRIVKAANRQHRLIADLLLLSQLDAEIVTPTTRIVPLAPLVRQAVVEVQESYAGQRIDLDGPPILDAAADPDRTVQILANLLDNAAKYSPEGSPIMVSWRREDEMIAIRVRDHGQGIAEQGRERLFTRFGRVPGSRIRSGRVGTGLGLYLSRALAEAMGGALRLEATGPTGSTFLLLLPSAIEDLNGRCPG